MKKQRLPSGWTQKSVRQLAQYHDNLTEEAQAAEIEAALAQEDQTLMAVPTELVPEIVQLIARKQRRKPA